MKKIYIVTFQRQADCTTYDMVFHCEANNAKEACQIAKDEWPDYCKKWYGRNGLHLFHLHAVKSRTQDKDLIAIHDWLGMSVKGPELIGSFHCTDYRRWRINGINQYGPRAGQHYRA